ncbi:hypothetical protein [Methylobacterium gregans]
MAAVEAVVDGVSTTVQVPAYVSDPVAHVRETYSALGMDVTETEFLALGAQPAGGYARSEEGDKVVAEVGTRAARAARELAVRDEVRASFDRVASNFGTDAATLFGPHGIDMDEQMVLVANPPPADDGAEVVTLPVAKGSGPAVPSEPDAAAA